MKIYHSVLRQAQVCQVGVKLNPPYYSEKKLKYNKPQKELFETLIILSSSQKFSYLYKDI